MATKKISELDAADALDDADSFPVVQDGETRKATVAQIAAVRAGTADAVDAAGLIVPSGDNTSGLISKAPDSSWGAAGETAPDTDPNYGTGQFLSFHKEGAGDASDNLLFRVDRTGGLGLGGGLHIATGYRQRIGYPVPSQCVWIDPTVNAIPLVIHNPSVAESATWDKHYIYCYDVRNSRAVFTVAPTGVIEAPNALPSGTRMRVFDHFTNAGTQATNLGQSGGSAGYALLSGTAAQITQTGVTITDAAGVATCSTGTDATGYCAISFVHENVVFTAASSDIVFGARLKVPNLSTAGEQHEVRAGMCNTFSGTAPTQGLYFRLQHGDTNWEAVNRRAGTETVVDTGVAGVGNTWVNLKFKITASGNAVYYINGTQVASISTNKPTDNSGLFALVGIAKAVGTTARTVAVDAMNLDYAFDNNLEQILA